MNRRQSGREAEYAAEMYLKNHGYEILDRNYYGDRCEIDLIARKGNIIVFVEVKSSASQIAPETQVNSVKIEHIARAATSYLAENEAENVDYRFDVIALTRKGENWKVKHYEDAFRL